MRFLLSCCAVVAALCWSSSLAAGELPLVESFHVIYRDATDDYLFRANFSYDIELNPSPDAALTFWVFGERPSDGLVDSLAIVGDLKLFDQSTVPTIKTTQLQSFQYSAGIDYEIEGHSVSFLVPRSQIVASGPSIDLLFPYSISAGLWDGSADFQYPSSAMNSFPLVALNVPEPSTLLIASGTLLMAIPPLRRRFLRRRQPSP